MPISIRQATMGDYDALVALFDELDVFHRRARPEVVRSGLRSQGIGRHLIDAIVDWSRGQGASHLGVAVHAFNRDARRFYERAGFAPSIDRLVLAV
jgi:GNAT superfamily N-acetyltransferase